MAPRANSTRNKGSGSASGVPKYVAPSRSKSDLQAIAAREALQRRYPKPATTVFSSRETKAKKIQKTGKSKTPIVAATTKRRRNKDNHSDKGKR